MNPKAEEIFTRFRDDIKDLKGLLFITRGLEILQDARGGLENIKNELGQLKQEMIQLGDEDAANLILSLEHISSAIIEEFSMWIHLKEDNPNTAWDNLINAQDHAVTAIQVHKLAEEFEIESYINRLHALERVLFPHQVFVSAAMIIGETTCSICGNDSDECEHIPGKPYMGEICLAVVSRIISADHVAIVENPADKRCRILEFPDANNMNRDVMTYRKIEKESNTAG
jgi:hypothetical protein